MRIMIKRMRRTKLLKAFDVVFESEEIKFQEQKQLKKQLKVPKQSAERLNQIKQKLALIEIGNQSMTDKIRARFFEKISIDKHFKTYRKCRKLAIINSDTHRPLCSLDALEQKLEEIE